MGLSSGFGERAFLTLGAHWGRIEKLLLGDEKEVSKVSVPTTVGDDSAIGTRWKGAAILVLSWRL
jgi:hypothetical protein